MSDKKEDLDDLINFFLHKFTEDSLFKSSAEHWLSSGKPSGSFRESLHAMLESWASKRNTFSKSEIDSLKAQLSSKEQECDELKQERRRYEKQYHGLVDENASLRAENEAEG